MPKSPPRMTRTRAPQPARADWGTSKPKRMTGRRLQRERERLFAERPLCVGLPGKPCGRPATIRDHRVALAFDGEDVTENTDPMCADCHDAKSKAEAAEGARRARAGGRSKV